MSDARASLSLADSRLKASTQAAHRGLADAVRMLIAADPGAPRTLGDIGRDVGASPYHLVRVFREQIGLPIHRYRNRLRLRLALERLAEGECDLTSLALNLGFASHSHFTDAFRREFCVSPSAFGRQIGARPLGK
jgi:AraC-like DNA-binding protein